MEAPQKAKTRRTKDEMNSEETKFLKEEYTRQNGVEELQQYVNTLTAFLVLRFSLNDHSKEIKFSINNSHWGKFGDIVIETIDEKNTKIHAIQCKHIKYRKDITIAALGAENGKFSIKEQCEILQQLRKKDNFQITDFQLFTVANVVMEDFLRIMYDDNMVKKWKKKNGNEDWIGREIIVVKYKNKSLINTTDDSNNICIMKVSKGGNDLMDENLEKLSLFTNQQKISVLQQQINTLIEEKFGIKKDLSDDIIKYVSDFFQKNNENCCGHKMKKRDIILKVAELILKSNLLFPESVVEEKMISPWDETISKFDVIVIKNSSDLIQKMYSSINIALKRKIGPNIDFSLRKLTVEKDQIEDQIMKSEIFSIYPSKLQIDCLLEYLYIALWKIEEAPLVLTADNESDLQQIIRIVSFLKKENLSLKFILATNLEVDHSYFPDNLKTFINLADLANNTDEEFLGKILLQLKIPVLDFFVDMKKIVDLNDDFLNKVTPEALLNMSLDDYSLKNVFVPITDDIIENTLVFSDDTMEKLNFFFEKTGIVEETNNLSYVVNVQGSPTRIEIPPDI